MQACIIPIVFYTDHPANDRVTWIDFDDCRITLTYRDKLTIDTGRWLSDNVIVVCQFIISVQFPQLVGLRDTQLFSLENEHTSTEQLSARLDKLRRKSMMADFVVKLLRSNGRQIQILHKSSNHWVTLSNLHNGPIHHIYVYDSLNSCRGDVLFVHQVAAIFRLAPPCSELKLIWPSVQHQGNYTDCGVFAVANMTTLAFGLDPSSQHFKISVSEEIRTELHFFFDFFLNFNPDDKV
jgi:hypothetical protein